MIELYSMDTGNMGTNCYAVKDVATGLIAAIDCTAYNREYLRFLKKNSITKLEYILITHGHFDHICGVYDLKENCGGKVAISEQDAECLCDEDKSFNSTMGEIKQKFVTPDILLKDGDVLQLGETEIRVIATPGHTLGSLCFLVDDALFTGDTLGLGAKGRTDLGGCREMIIPSIDRLIELVGDKKVYPGHGFSTSTMFERKFSSAINTWPSKY